MIDARFLRYRLRVLFGVQASVLGAVFSVLAAGGVGAAAGCSGDKASGVAVAKAPQASRSEAIEHEPCSESGSHVESIDTNNDGKADIHRVFDGSGHEQCRTIDLNHDGHVDLYEYLDAAGTIRRREFCYDDTGAVNAIEYYEGGKLVRREYDTTGQRKIDTWDWFDPAAAIDAKTGRPTHPIRRERDTHGNGTVDQWWTWDGSKLSIATDRNGDGQPDPASVIVLGGAGGDDGGAPASGDGGALAIASDASAQISPGVASMSAMDGGKP